MRSRHRSVYRRTHHTPGEQESWLCRRVYRPHAMPSRQESMDSSADGEEGPCHAQFAWQRRDHRRTPFGAPHVSRAVPQPSEARRAVSDVDVSLNAGCGRCQRKAGRPPTPKALKIKTKIDHFPCKSKSALRVALTYPLLSIFHRIRGMRGGAMRPVVGKAETPSRQTEIPTGTWATASNPPLEPVRFAR